MDLRKVKKLIELLEESALAEMEITEGDNSIRLSRAGTPMVPTQQYSSPPQVSPDGQRSPERDEPGASASQDEESGTVIASPMVGTYYNSSSPDADPYVQVGTKVKEGDVLCIIEAMKTFNQFEAEMSGTIKGIYKSTGDPVEYGEPLFLID